MLDPPPDLASRYEQTFERLLAEELEVAMGDPVLRDPENPEAGARVPVEVEMQLDGLGPWSYDLEIPTVPRPGQDTEQWAVQWSPAVLHPALEEGSQLDRVREWPDRAPILGADGQPLSDGPGAFGRVVGTTGPINDELLERLGDPYLPDDVVGLRGLQLAYEQRLAGTPSGEVRLVDDEGAVVETLHEFQATEPQPVRTGLDPDVQRAAEAALDPSLGNAAMVVLDTETAAIRAIVNRPEGGFNRALSGRYPPGSTFKVVTTVALLRNGITPSTPVSCPPEAVVGGRPFTNFEDQAFGEIPFREAFFRSCNTAFVQLAADLPENALIEAARDVGFGSTDWSLPVGDPIASFPEPQDLAERAAAAFGQARVEASPVSMAGIAAAMASGSWQPPRLVLPESAEGATADEEGPGSVSLPEADTIADLMQEVPRVGTASGAGLPDGVAGKTGTAEYGTGDPLPTHAWFIGFDPRRDEPLAWAILVEGGSSGGSVAAPVAAKFLAELG